MAAQLPPIEDLYPLIWNAVRAVIYLLIAGLVSLLVNLAFKRFQAFTEQLRRDRGGVEHAEFAKQSATLTTTIRRVSIFMVWALAVVLALKEMNVDVAPILAGAGVAGLAVGFAAQSLLKDVISGLFLLAEGYMRINDVVKIGDVSGVVEELTLRTTVLRGVDGAVHVISNGNIAQFTNLTRLYAFYVVDLTVDLDADTDQVVAIVKQAAGELQQDKELGPLILEPLEVLGVDRFTEQGVVLRSRLKIVANQQWKVGRELNRRIKKALESNGIVIATAQRQVTVQHIDPVFREELRTAVEQIVASRQQQPPPASA